MNQFKDAYIKYRIEKSDEAFNDAQLLLKSKSYNSCVNRLYYSCYYDVSAICLKAEINTHTHSGLKAKFNERYVKTGLVALELGKLYTDLQDWRLKGDYGDMYGFDLETTKPLVNKVKEFNDFLKKLINMPA